MGRLESVTGRVIRTPHLTSRRHIDLLRVCSAISPLG
ncbi:putative leader peptide [Streptomyces chartreusis]